MFNKFHCKKENIVGNESYFPPSFVHDNMLIFILILLV